jgi:hypothetical protein
MDISKLRKKVYLLDVERRKIQNYLLKPQDMIRGSLYKMYRRCGNPNCKCARGDKHEGNYISMSKDGKTHLTYVKNKHIDGVKKKTSNYKKYQRRMARIRKINKEVFSILKKIRDEKVKEYK